MLLHVTQEKDKKIENPLELPYRHLCRKRRKREFGVLLLLTSQGQRAGAPPHLRGDSLPARPLFVPPNSLPSTPSSPSSPLLPLTPPHAYASNAKTTNEKDITTLAAPLLPASVLSRSAFGSSCLGSGGLQAAPVVVVPMCLPLTSLRIRRASTSRCWRCAVCENAGGPAGAGSSGGAGVLICLRLLRALHRCCLRCSR